MEDYNFFSQVDLELKRAERYSVFVSLVVLDFSFLQEYSGPDTAAIMSRLFASARRNVREVDILSMTDESKIVLLMPETPRQGAEIAGRRIRELLRDRLSAESGELADHVIPMEMASYPDAAGARTIRDFLREYSESHRN